MPLLSRSSAALRPHQRVRLQAATAAGEGIWNLALARGGYVAAWIAGGNIRVGYTSHATPPFQHEAQATFDGSCSEPRLAEDSRGTLILCHRMAGESLRMLSYDDALTFEEAGMPIAGGDHLTVAVGVDGSTIYAAYVAGNIVGVRQEPGDAEPGAEFTFEDDNGDPLEVVDGSFHLVQAREGPGRWILHVRIQGESETSHWASSDDAASWQRL